jgi:Rieske Fe-S protein
MSCQSCTRRDFLARSAVAAAALVAVEGCGDGQIGPAAPAGDGGAPVTIRVADFPDLATVGTVVDIGGSRALVRTSATPAAFRGLSKVCTHQQCITDVRNNRFECPCHGSIFANDGAVVRGPNVANSGITPLRTLTTSFDPTRGEVTVS